MEKQDHILSEALSAFWFVIRASHPEIKTNELPEQTDVLKLQALNHYRQWLAHNYKLTYIRGH